MNAPAKVTLEPGMVILIPSDGGFAPDATDAALAVVNHAGPLHQRGRVQIEDLDGGGTRFTRFIDREVYADSVRIIDMRCLILYLDVLGLPDSHAVRASEAAQIVLRNPEQELFLSPPRWPTGRGKAEVRGKEVHETIEDEYAEIAAKYQVHEWSRPVLVPVWLYSLVGIALAIGAIAGIETLIEWVNG